MPVRSIKLGQAFAGIIAGAALAAGPSLIILSRAPVPHLQEAILWAVNLLLCTMLCASAAIKIKRTSLLCTYAFVFLYCALAILCLKLNIGAIEWQGVKNLGVAMCIAAASVVVMALRYLQKPAPLTTSLYKQIYLSVTVIFLTGIAFVYATWLPVLAVPGALVLVYVCDI